MPEVKNISIGSSPWGIRRPGDVVFAGEEDAFGVIIVPTVAFAADKDFCHDAGAAWQRQLNLTRRIAVRRADYWH